MSLILDALNKADRERQDSESPPGLQSNHNFLSGNEKMAGWKKTVVFAVAGLILLAAAAAYYLGKQSGVQDAIISSPAAEMPKPQPVAAEPAKVETVANNTESKPKATVAAAAQTAETRALLQKRRIEEQYKKAQAANTQTTAATAPSETENAPDKISALYQPETKPVETRPEPIQTGRESTARVAQAEGNAAAESSPAPAGNAPSLGNVRDLPWSIQEKIPTLMYTEHSYTGTPNDFVTINGERRKVGQKVANILTIDSILADGVILKYESYQFKMPALNSWVNM
jgi:hypothetical protein